MHRTLGIAHMDVHIIFAINSFVTVFIDLDRTTSLQERSGGFVFSKSCMYALSGRMVALVE